MSPATHVYRCAVCGTLSPYSCTAEQAAARPTRACVWGGCPGTARAMPDHQRSQPGAEAGKGSAPTATALHTCPCHRHPSTHAAAGPDSDDACPLCGLGDELGEAEPTPLPLSTGLAMALSTTAGAPVDEPHPLPAPGLPKRWV